MENECFFTQPRQILGQFVKISVQKWVFSFKHIEAKKKKKNWKQILCLMGSKYFHIDLTPTLLLDLSRQCKLSVSWKWKDRLGHDCIVIHYLTTTIIWALLLHRVKGIMSLLNQRNPAISVCSWNHLKEKEHQAAKREIRHLNSNSKGFQQ